MLDFLAELSDVHIDHAIDHHAAIGIQVPEQFFTYEHLSGCDHECLQQAEFRRRQRDGAAIRGNASLGEIETQILV